MANNYQMYQVIIILNLLFVIINNSFCQALAKDKGISTQFFTGISIQKFALQQWFKPNSGATLYLLGAEQNAEGIGLEIPVEFYCKRRNFGLLTNPIIRYDVTKPAPFAGPNVAEEKSLFADFHLSFFRKLTISKHFKQPLKIGIGYSFISPFLSYENPNPKLIPYKEINLDFAGPHLLLTLPVGKLIYIKQQLMYIPKGQIMYTDFSEALMFHLSVGVNLNELLVKRSD